MAYGNKDKARRKRRTLGWHVRRFFGYVTLLVLLSTLVGLLFIAGVFYSVARDLPAPEDIMNYTPGGVTEIYATDKDKNGRNVVLGRVYVENREFVPITKMPEVIKKATVAIEDERFYQHPGIDLRGIARALYVNARGGRLLEGQGGSTLTQQLARNVYLTRKKTVSRKVQEMMLALQIEKNFSKEQILEMYLNEVYYGSGAYGVQAASKVYFGRSIDKLSLSQAALLAGLPQLPNKFSPYEDKEAAITRRNIVLTKMNQLGYIDDKAAKVAKSNGVRLIGEKPRDQFEFKAPYFVNYVIRQLVDRYGSEAVYKGGLKVYTTLNYKMQHEAEQALVRGVKGASWARVTEGALVCVEPNSGYIRSMVGGIDFKRNQYNNVVQGRRQPGSAFKPFVYTAAFDLNRYGPYSRISDTRVSFPMGGGRWYTPQNYGGSFHGTVTLRQALTHSYNIPAVKIANEIGPSRVIDYARRMGIVSPLEPNLSLALGAYPVSPLEIASAYTVFATGGNRAVPMSVIRVLNNEGEILEENAPQVETAVISESTARDISAILQDVVTRGTAAGARGIHAVANAHGKTGTTNDNKDAWFVGYTPELVTAVWVCGAEFAKKGTRWIPIKYPPMLGVTGGRVCAPIWAQYMQQAVQIQRTATEPAPLPTEKITRRAAAELSSVYGERLDEREDRSRDERRRRSRERRRQREQQEQQAQATETGGTDTPEAATQPDTFSSPSTVPAVSVGAGPRTAEPAAVRNVHSSGPVSTTSLPAPAPPAPVTPPPPRDVSVTICPDSGQRATQWCPETVTRTVSASRAPRGSCRLHRPRPGDG